MDRERVSLAGTPVNYWRGWKPCVGGLDKMLKTWLHPWERSRMMLFLLCIRCFRCFSMGNSQCMSPFLQVTKRRPRDSSIASVGREEAEVQKLTTTCHSLATFCTFIADATMSPSLSLTVWMHHTDSRSNYYFHWLDFSCVWCCACFSEYLFFTYFLSITTPPTH